MKHEARIFIHSMRMVAITLVIVACLFLPFLPGRYDSLAIALSIMAQMAGVAGLLLVPIGGVWLAYESRKKPASDGRLENDKGYYFAWAAVIASSIAAAFVCLGALFGAGYSFGIAVMALCVFGAWRMVASLRRMKRAGAAGFNPVPVYLLAIPAVVALVQFTLLGRAAALSRERVIRHSAQLIIDIEQYYRTRGHYPPSLLALWSDYRPGVVGVRQFHYEPNGDAYNVYFEQLSTAFGAQEIVMYNKRDEHIFLSHDSDRLLWTAEQIRSRRTYLSINDASTPHWKYFLFD
jgi:cbb3-type cytochrome oxidase subunit 3